MMGKMRHFSYIDYKRVMLQDLIPQASNADKNKVVPDSEYVTYNVDCGDRILTGWQGGGQVCMKYVPKDDYKKGNFFVPPPPENLKSASERNQVINSIIRDKEEEKGDSSQINSMTNSPRKEETKSGL
jgi:hypothetical protein